MTLSTNEHAWALEAIAHVEDALQVCDVNVRIVYMNEAAERLVGNDELNGDATTWGEGKNGVYYPDKTTVFPWHELPLLRALGGEHTRDIPMFLRTRSRPEGFHVAGSAIPLYDENGKIRGGAVIFRDLTHQIAREAALRESEKQKRAILDNIPDMAWLKDKDGRFLVVNQRLAKAAGYDKPEDLVGKNDFDLWPHELAAGYRADDEEVMRTGEHKIVEEQHLQLPGGQRFWIETVKTRIVDDEGNVIGTTGIAHDITARRNAHLELEKRVLQRTTELREAQENLVRQERLAILGQLAGGVAHQIRNPLAAIMNATFVLLRHHTPEAHQNVMPALRIIQDEVRHANVIITGLLDYARVRTPDRHPTSVTELVERILQSDWIPPSVHVTRRLPEDDPVVREVDADQLGGAISNLVRNAVEAMPSGGKLEVTLTTNDDALSLVVSDNGMGISPQVRGHLFEPLQSTKPMGIGLGLVTARRFVEAHGGQITLLEQPRGAAFEIRLPNR